jgi:hypothetical protein
MAVARCFPLGCDGRGAARNWTGGPVGTGADKPHIFQIDSQFGMVFTG